MCFDCSKENLRKSSIYFQLYLRNYILACYAIDPGSVQWLCVHNKDFYKVLRLAFSIT